MLFGLLHVHVFLPFFQEKRRSIICCEGKESHYLVAISNIFLRRLDEKSREMLARSRDRTSQRFLRFVLVQGTVSSTIACVSMFDMGVIGWQQVAGPGLLPDITVQN
jgi:hypothetical protein